jgi:hypothetical protein
VADPGEADQPGLRQQRGERLDGRQRSGIGPAMDEQHGESQRLDATAGVRRQEVTLEVGAELAVDRVVRRGEFLLVPLRHAIGHPRIAEVGRRAQPTGLRRQGGVEVAALVP